MSVNMNGHPVASVAVFCPQSKAPGESYLNQLYTFLRQCKYLQSFGQNIAKLKDVWTILANERQDIADLGQGPRYMQSLSEWITTGKSSQIANCMSGILSLPLLVVIQTCQYFQYLELHGMSHAQFIAQLREGGGMQGYCGGLLPAIAIACSKNETEVAENAAIAARIALAIGAYGELGDDESVPGATTIVVRTKRVGQGDELVKRFPGVSSLNGRLFPSSHHRVDILTSEVIYIRCHGPENTQRRWPGASPSQASSLRTRARPARARNVHSGQSTQSRERGTCPGAVPAVRQDREPSTSSCQQFTSPREVKQDGQSDHRSLAHSRDSQCNPCVTVRMVYTPHRAG